MSQPPASQKQTRPVKLTDSPLPLYYQLATRLRGRILDGEWPAGTKLPTEADLARSFGVSRLTIRKAKARLALEGLIRSVQGSGCFVNSPEEWRSQPPTVDSLGDVFRFGGQMAFKIMDFRMRANERAVALRLKNEGDRFIFQIKGVRYQYGEPISYVVYYLPHELGSRIALKDLDEGPMIPQFERLAGIRAVEGVKTVSISRLGKEAARGLGLRAGMAALLEETVYVDQDGRPIEYLQTWYRERLPYNIRVKRNGGARPADEETS